VSVRLVRARAIRSILSSRHHHSQTNKESVGRDFPPLSRIPQVNPGRSVALAGRGNQSRAVGSQCHADGTRRRVWNLQLPRALFIEVVHEDRAVFAGSHEHLVFRSEEQSGPGCKSGVGRVRGHGRVRPLPFAPSARATSRLTRDTDNPSSRAIALMLRALSVWALYSASSRFSQLARH